MTTPLPPAPQADLRRVLESLPDPFFILDGGWRFTFINARGAAFVGREPAKLVGRAFWDEFPETLGTRFETEMRRARHEGQVVEYEEYFAPLSRWLEVRVFPDGDGLAVHYRNVTERVLGERRARVLSGVTAALARPLTRGEVTHAVLTHALPALGAYGGTVVRLSVDGRAVEVEQTLGYDGSSTAGWGRFELDAPLPATVCVREDRPIYVSEADLARDYPHLLALKASVTRSLAALPLRFGESVSGALLLSFAQDHSFDDAERQFMLDIAAQCSQALARAQAFDTQARAARHAHALVDLGARLTHARSAGEVAQALVEHGRQASGAYGGALYLLGEDGLHLREVERQGYPAATPAAWRRLHLEGPSLPGLVARDGEARFVHDADFAALYPQVQRAERTRAVAVLPLAVEGGCLGVLALAYEHDPEFDTLKRGFLTSLAAQAALALERTRLTQAAHQERDRYRSLVEATAQIVWTTDGGGAFVTDQPSWRAFTGQSAQVLRGWGWREAVHPDDLERVSAGWRHRLGTRTLFEDTFRLRRFDGEYRDMLTRAVPVLEPDGSVREWVGVNTDVTERRAQEATLQDREERYRVLSNVTNDAIWEWQFEGDRLTWNGGVHTLFGYAGDGVEPTVRWWQDRIHPQDRARVLTGIDAVIDGPENEWRDEYRFARADGTYATVLDRGQVIRDAGGAAIRMIGGMTDLSEREQHRREVETLNASLERRVEQRTGELRERAAELQAETDALSTFAAFTQAVGNETDLTRLAQLAVNTLIRAFGSGSAVYYDRDGDLWKASTWTGDLTGETLALARQGFPLHALTPDPTQTGARFVEEWASVGGEVGEQTSEYGAAAFYLVCQDQDVYGLLTAGLKRANHWTPRDQAVFRAVGHGLSLAAERAAHLRRLEEERASTAAFAAFTEQVGTQTDVQVLARSAVDVLHTALHEVNVGYYELDGGRWKGRVLSNDVPPEVAQAALDGFPAGVNTSAGAAVLRDVLFVDDWDAGQVRVQETAMYRAAAFSPYFVDERPYGLLTMASRHEPVWSPRARAVFSSVARGLGLAFERAEAAQLLREQNAELNVRTRALEGFSELARDLAFETDAAALVRRAQEIVLGLLPGGMMLYYEPDGPLWRVRVQTGDVGDAALQAAIDAGLPFEETGNLTVPWRSGEPYYQDAYAPDTDGLAEQTRHIGATATLPISVHGQPLGVLAVALFGTRAWDATDRVMLETAARHLTLALERAAVLGELGRQRAELRAANAELEAFSYSVSHDLRAPLRHIAGFAGRLRRVMEQGDAEKAAQTLDMIESAVTRSQVLIDALLGFSHLTRRALREASVDLNGLVNGLRAEAEQEAGGREVEWAVGSLPRVKGDPDLLRQVLANLLSNAVKYSAKSQRLRVEVGGEQTPGETVVFVRDSGAGFDPRYADRLFGVFQRLHHPSEFEGTGIGLATVQRIVQRHGGRVWAESRPGEGATFSFSLPRT